MKGKGGDGSDELPGLKISTQSERQTCSFTGEINSIWNTRAAKSIAFTSDRSVMIYYIFWIYFGPYRIPLRLAIYKLSIPVLILFYVLLFWLLPSLTCYGEIWQSSSYPVSLLERSSGEIHLERDTWTRWQNPFVSSTRSPTSWPWRAGRSGRPGQFIEGPSSRRPQGASC